MARDKGGQMVASQQTPAHAIGKPSAVGKERDRAISQAIRRQYTPKHTKLLR